MVKYGAWGIENDEFVVLHLNQVQLQTRNVECGMVIF